MRRALAAALLAGAAAPAPAPGLARTLPVGPGREFAAPSQAAAAAQDGDTVSIAPGTYFDCIATARARLVIEGEADGVVLTDRTCQGKALLVLDGDGATVRRLTLARARVPDGNGAGIRLEAPSLRVEQVTFLNDQVGLLASAPGGTIEIVDSRFSQGGTTGERALSAVMAPASRLLRITGSRFEAVDGGQVWTSAERSELVGNRFELGAGAAPRAAVWAVAGRLLLEDDVFTAGPNRLPQDAAVVLLDGASAALRRNRLDNRTGAPLSLLLDWSFGAPALDGNEVGPGDRALSSDGLVRHRVSTWAHGAKDGLRAFAGRMKRLVAGPR